MLSKRYKALPQKTKKLKYDSIDNLLRTVKKNCTTKFDESIDVNFQLNLKQKKSEVNIRTVLNLPVGKNKKIKVAVICEEEKLEEAKKSGADIIGSDDLINIMEFCKAFNEKTKNFMGNPVPVVITVYKDKKFDFIIKSPPASHFIKQAAKLKSGSKEPGRIIKGTITMKQAEQIAKEKIKDLNAFDLKKATKIICGSARSMGIEVKE